MEFAGADDMDGEPAGPAPAVSVVVAPAYWYYGRRFGFNPGYRFYARHSYWPRHHCGDNRQR